MREAAKASHIFSTKNIGVFQIFTFEILTNVVSFEQPGPGVVLQEDLTNACLTASLSSRCF